MHAVPITATYEASLQIDPVLAILTRRPRSGPRSIAAAPCRRPARDTFHAPPRGASTAPTICVLGSEAQIRFVRMDTLMPPTPFAEQRHAHTLSDQLGDTHAPSWRCCYGVKAASGRMHACMR